MVGRTTAATNYLLFLEDDRGNVYLYRRG